MSMRVRRSGSDAATLPIGSAEADPASNASASGHEPSSPETAVAPRARRERSTIQFPYGSLNDAVDIAQVLGQLATGEGTVGEIADRLGYVSLSNGSFRLKLSTARTFGVVRIQSQTVGLTDLGRRLLAPAQRRQAKIEAFLGVPLYRSLFERFAGRLLPQDVAIEAEIVQLGVAPKQRDKARQAFQRSAQQAGLFFDGRDRLAIPPDLEPVFSGSLSADSATPSDGPPRPAAERLTPAPAVHPAIQGLLHMLPPAGDPWPDRLQDQWLAAMKNIFGLIYPEDPAP